MELVNEALAGLGIPPVLVGTAVLLGIVLRFARAGVWWFGSGWMYVYALGLGILGGIVHAMKEKQASYDAVLTCLAMVAATLIVQRALQWAADSGKFPFLPRDNEWAKKPEEQPKP